MFDQRWELPGGRLHIDEVPHDGLRREVMEELGAEINVTGIHDTFTFFRGDMQHFCVVYRCELAPTSAEPCPDGVELKDIRWVSSVDELNGLSFSAGFRETVEKFLLQALPLTKGVKPRGGNAPLRGELEGVGPMGSDLP